MAHFILTPFGSAGDVLPLIWIGRHLRGRGHRTTLITSAAFQTPVERAGLEFIPIGTREEYEQALGNPDLWQGRAGASLVVGHAFRNAANYCAAIRACAGDRSDTLILSQGTAFGARLAREATGLRLLSVHIHPASFFSVYETPVYANGLEWLCRLPRWMKRAVRALPMRLGGEAMRALQAACRAQNVTPPRRPMRDWWHSPDGVIGLFPEWLAAPQPDWPANTRLHNFPLEDLGAEQPASPELEQFLAAGAPPMVFTPGSAMHHGTAFFGAATEAVSRLKARAVFVTSHRAHLPAGLPDSIHVEAYVPFHRLFARASVVCHHGGIGTFAQGLVAGVPQLIMPMLFDQPDNAHRAVRLGVGRKLLPARFTADALTPVLKELRESERIRQACQTCAARVQAGPAPSELMAWIEAQLTRPTATGSGR